MLPIALCRAWTPQLLLAAAQCTSWPRHGVPASAALLSALQLQQEAFHLSTCPTAAALDLANARDGGGGVLHRVHRWRQTRCLRCRQLASGGIGCAAWERQRDGGGNSRCSSPGRRRSLAGATAFHGPAARPYSMLYLILDAKARVQGQRGPKQAGFEPTREQAGSAQPARPRDRASRNQLPL